MTHYLTRITITPQLLALRHIYSTYGLHCLAYGLLDPSDQDGNEGRRGPLWALSTRGDRMVILSSRRPQGDLGGLAQIREFPGQLLQAPRLRFMLVANPVRRGATGKREAITDPGEALGWLAAQGGRHGFEPLRPTLSVHRIWADTFSKGAGQRITINKALLSGVLEVTSGERFRAAALGGIGHAKSFGCGLLQILPTNFQGIDI